MWASKFRFNSKFELISFGTTYVSHVYGKEMKGKHPTQNMDDIKPEW